MANTTSNIKIVFDGVAKGVVAAAAAAKAAVASVGDGTDGVTKKIQKFGDSYTAAISKATLFTSKWVAIGVAGGGLIGQAFAGALPAVVALGAAGATVALGMDGIKKVAGQLKGPFDQLKKSVSATFAESLAGPFKQLAGVIPKLSDGFQIVAVSISQVVGQLVDVVSSTAGIEKLQTVLKATGNFILGLGEGLAGFLDGFLSAVAAAAPAMKLLGQGIGDIFDQVGAALNNLAADGAIVAAVKGLAATFSGLGLVLGPLVELLVRMGAALGPSLGVVFSAIGAAVTTMTPGMVSLAGAVGDILTAAAPLVPVLGQLANDAFKSIADALRDVTPLVRDFAAWAQANPGAVKTIAAAVLGLATAFKVLEVALAINAAITATNTALATLGTAASAAATKIGAAGLGRALSGLKAALVAGGIAVGLGVAAVAMDKINQAGANGAPLTGFKENLHDIAGAAQMIASGDVSGIIGQQITDAARADQPGLEQPAQTPIQHVVRRPSRRRSKRDFLGVLGNLGSTVGGDPVRDRGSSFQTDFLDVFAALPGEDRRVSVPAGVDDRGGGVVGVDVADHVGTVGGRHRRLVRHRAPRPHRRRD
jgi:hypothetical protein